MKMVGDDLVKWQEEQNKRLYERKKPVTFNEWKARKLRENSERTQREEEETKVTSKRLSEKVNMIVFQYFKASVEGIMRPWDYVLVPKIKGLKRGKTTLRDGIVACDLAHDSNIFNTPEDYRNYPPPEEMTDEQILEVLSKNLPTKPFFVETQKGSPQNPHYGLTRVELKRMLKP